MYRANGDNHHQLNCQFLQRCICLLSKLPVSKLDGLGYQLLVKGFPIAANFGQLGERNRLDIQASQPLEMLNISLAS